MLEWHLQEKWIKNHIVFIQLWEMVSWQRVLCGKALWLAININPIIYAQLLIGIIFEISGNTEDVMGHEILSERISSFGWHVISVADGNDIDQLNAAFEEAKNVKGKADCCDCQYR